jgi:hypothetical protein
MAGALRVYKLQLTGSSTSGGGAMRLYKLQLTSTPSAVKLRLYKLKFVGNVGQFYDWNGTALAVDPGGSILYWDTTSSTWK